MVRLRPEHEEEEQLATWWKDKLGASNTSLWLDALGPLESFFPTYNPKKELLGVDDRVQLSMSFLMSGAKLDPWNWSQNLFQADCVFHKHANDHSSSSSSLESKEGWTYMAVGAWDSPFKFSMLTPPPPDFEKNLLTKLQ
jgi:hypothetical protein